jgi:hypothetical protein
MQRDKYQNNPNGTYGIRLTQMGLAIWDKIIPNGMSDKEPDK